MILSDFEWLSKIFDDTKHRSASLRQQSYLYDNLCKTGVRRCRVDFKIRCVGAEEQGAAFILVNSI